MFLQVDALQWRSTSLLALKESRSACYSRQVMTRLLNVLLLIHYKTFPGKEGGNYFLSKH